ncbi:MAG: hypothetical protein FJ145_24245 [Deltaproteobacteria bacterium]|nr:hypothetical protein [Deltaproteobacteria bacterium]
MELVAKQQNFTLPDARDRALAIGTFDRNIVVTAGAGTGKTTLLVDRLVHLLLRNPDPVAITDIVSLTFTNKAADEMKQRLRERLQSYLAVSLDRTSTDSAEEKNQSAVQGLIQLYQLSKEEMDGRIHNALRDLDRSNIGTIHSFAATLLRLYPLEAGVDPQFREDDGAEFEGLFDEQWDNWLGQELALTSPRAPAWRRVLARFQIEQIKQLAKSLASETVELNNPVTKTIPAAVADWLAQLESAAAELVENHSGDRSNDKVARAALAILRDFRKSGSRSEQLAAHYQEVADRSINPKLVGWSPEECATLREIARAVNGLGTVDAELTALLWNLLGPFAAAFREQFVSAGHLSFDALLVRARNLVRDDRRVRGELKRRFRAILIDEFQDTDPIQYEILLYLAEQPGSLASDWRQVKLAPGKVFVVGDPKQSIYAFRRADIEAYLEVVEKIIKAQDGIECRLTTNFRSNREILDVVNGAFEKLICAQEGLQPDYIGIEPAPGRGAATTKIPNVLVRKILSGDNEKLDAETARRLEGQTLARWLKEEVLGKAPILNTRGEPVLAQPRDVAILLRRLTDIHDYLEPLRRHGIRYVVEGERQFYSAKEIIDAVNLLRAVENPHDRLALVGVLRSPLGGITDQQIYELHREGLLDYRAWKKLDATKYPTNLVRLYTALARLHSEVSTMPIGSAMAHLFATLPVELLAACHFHGEQAVANLQKLQQQAEQLGHEGLTTLKAAIRQLEKRVLEAKDESESMLAEESLDAVRVMSIHKSKGLEFPIVILAGCQSGTDSARGARVESLFEWSSGLTGLVVNQPLDLAALYVSEKTRRRDREEQKRLFYVAMTRVREHLVVSCAPANRHSGGFLDLLDGTVDSAIGDCEESTSISLGRGKVYIHVTTETLTAPSGEPHNPDSTQEKPNWQAYVSAWARRANSYKKTQQLTPFLTPTLLKQQEATLGEATAERPHRSVSEDIALAIGNLTHGFLQHWDFAGDAKRFEPRLKDYVDHKLPEEFLPQQREIIAELEEIFRHFFGSDIYSEIAGAKILGREVPLVMPWEGQIMEGVIDLIYERDNLLYIADYKTDRIAKNELQQGAERFRQQQEIYTAAVRQSLRRPVAAFKVIFLRAGAAVEIAAKPNTQLALF